MASTPLLKRRISLKPPSPRNLIESLASNLAIAIAIPIVILEFLKKHDTMRKLLIAWAVGLPIVHLLFPTGGLATLLSLAMLALNFVYAIFFMVVQFGSLFWFMGRTRSTEIHPGDPKTITWDDYWGQKHLVSRVQQWNKLLLDREVFKAMGGEALNGLLMDGPPGTGKTMMAKALAGSGGVAFLGVEGSTFRGMFWGMDHQPLDALMLTLEGWKKNKDLRVGDSIIGRDGKTHGVLAVHPTKTRRVYRVCFADGSEVRASASHRWLVREWSSRIRGRPEYGQETLKSTVDLVVEAGRRDAIMCPAPIELPERDLPIEPYMLGALIGDGCMVEGTTPYVSSVDQQILERVGESAGRVGVLESPLYLSDGWTSKPNPVTDSLRDLELWGCKSPNKFIPEIYLCSSISQRVSLLQGLLDTDGSIQDNGKISFSTTSAALRDGVRDLVLSLGGVASFGSMYTNNGGSEWWQMSIRLPEAISPFYLERKADRVNGRNREYHLCRVVVDVVAEGEELVRCISTDAPDELYVTDGYVLTHNTMKVMGFVGKARKLAKRFGACIAYIDEIDAIGTSRGNVQTGAGGGQTQGAGPMGMMGSGALTRLLYEMDGIELLGIWGEALNRARGMVGLKPVDRGKVMFMGATNRPDVLDPALLRPGRFDQVIHVDAPDEEGRREVIEGYLNKITTSEDFPIDVDALVMDTPRATPAHIMSVITKDAPREAIFNDRDYVIQSDLELGFQEKLVGIANPISNWEPTQKKSVAAHEAGHAIAMLRWRPLKRFVHLSIIRRGRALGYALGVNPVDVYAHPQSDWVADIYVSMAGNIGSRIIMGEFWTGMGGDLMHVREVVFQLFAHGAFGSFPVHPSSSVPGQGISGAKAIDEAVDRFIDGANEIVESYLRSQIGPLSALTDELVEREDMTGDEAKEIIMAAVGGPDEEETATGEQL